MKNKIQIQNFTKANNMTKISNENYIQRFVYLLNKDDKNNKIIQNDEKEEEGLRNKYCIDKKYSPKILNNSRLNYYLRKKFQFYNEKISIIIIVFLIQIISNKNMLLVSFYLSNEIILKIRGTGTKKILSDSFSSANYPQSISINGESKTYINNQYNFIQDENIVILTWGNLITSCAEMFKDCNDIIEMDLSNFDTSQVNDMNYMFAHCSSLTSINLSYFNTQNVRNLFCMFRGCSSLTSIDVSSFNTNQATNVHYMFDGCASLTSINLENFHTPFVDEAEYMFANCINLEYINLKNFDGTNIVNEIAHYIDIFAGVPQNIVVQVNNNILGNIVKSQLELITCRNEITNDNNWKSQQKKIVNINGNCVNKCSEEPNNQYEYNGKCYSSCNKGYIIDNNTQEKICKCEIDKCLHCPPVAIRFRLCTECNTDYYQKENDKMNIGIYINCYKDPEEYYLDTEAHLYKKCYLSCLLCETKGNSYTHNCIECKQSFTIKFSFNNYLNCYESCNYYHYFDEEKNIYCTRDYTCPEDYPYLISRNDECSKNIDIIGIIERLGKDDTVLQYIEQYLTSEYYDTSNIDLGYDEIFNIEEITYTITTIDNQEKNQNITKINLGLCESYLKEYYNLNNITLYIKKIEINEKGMKTPKIEYDIYARLNSSKLEKLDLKKCNKKISLSFPVDLNGNLDELNTSSKYYNDACFIVTSENGIDITLNDRRKDYVNENKKICQEDCDFVEYNNETKIALCSCQIKESSTSFLNMKINKAQLFNAFIDINSIMNVNIMKCYKILFSTNGLLYNIGSYIIIIITYLHISNISIFFCVKYSKIKKQLINIFYAKKNIKLIPDLNKEKEKKKKLKSNSNSKNFIFLKTKNKFKNKKVK